MNKKLYKLIDLYMINLTMGAIQMDQLFLTNLDFQEVGPTNKQGEFTIINLLINIILYQPISKHMDDN